MLDRRVFLLLALALGPGAALANDPPGKPAEPPTKQACVSAYEQAQEARQSNRWREARDLLKLCANPACPPVVKADCGPWLAEVEKGQPSIVVLVRGEGGVALKGASIKLDGAPLSEAGPTEVDPGEHRIQVEMSGYKSHDRRFSVASGEKSLKVEVVLELTPSDSTPPPPPPGRSLTAPLILGGVGLVGLGVFTYFGLSGRSDENELKKCKPICPQSQVDDASRKYIIADVGLGVGVVALGVATYLFATSPKTTTSLVPWIRPGGAGGPGGPGVGVVGRF